MGNYLQWRDYFKDLAVKNIAISHSLTDPEKKKFFELSLEELLSSISQKFPGKSSGPFLIFSGYLDRLSFNNSTKKSKEFMLFIMESCGNAEYDLHTPAIDRCESVCEDFLRRMMKDSNENNALFQSSFDRIQNVSMIPNELKMGGNTYVGWQLSFKLEIIFDDCYKPLSWNA